MVGLADWPTQRHRDRFGRLWYDDDGVDDINHPETQKTQKVVVDDGRRWCVHDVRVLSHVWA